MRLAVIARDEDVPHYERAATRSNGHFTLTHFVTDLASTDGIDNLLSHQTEFDACVMLAPNSINAQQLDQLATARKHLLGNANHTTVEMLDQLATKWITAGATFSVAQPRRFTPYATAIYEGLAEQHLGSPGLVRIHRWLDNDPAETTRPNKALWQATVGEIDLACWLFNAAPDLVFARAIETNLPRAGILVHLGFEHGMALIDCILHEGKAFYTASLIGSQGAAYADDHRNTNLLMKGETKGFNVAESRPNGDWLRRQLSSFADTVQKRTTDTSVDAMKLAIQVSQISLQTATSNQVAKRKGDRYELQ